MAEQNTTPRVEVVSYETEQVVHVVKIPDGASAEHVDRGVNINLDHERFFTRLVDVEEEVASS